ncbi:TetR/AcrR family transcriptional regulator [Desulforhopalus singaporensis]|uniref:Transcriptional regulator, TetR family n=1 Tax=Desulforhopalus singaporensis TaxID=91360 RepID=A0A1H0PTH2_9BACT|nr:TetR/AcrR family transcriptional regulator [Desulforhopalus singaporensis]SDP07836.1 transcriptional regulator, TetR family [Desulforhopalus singaporensis]
MKKTSSAEKRSKIKAVRRIGAPSGPRNADRRRGVLIEAARTLFVEKGYEATTMDEIAAAADCAKGTLYHYFSNKAELLQVLREGFESEVMNRIRLRVDSCPVDDWQGRIGAWIEGAVDAYFEMHALHDVVIYGPGMPFRNAMADAQITRYLTRLISDGTKADAWKVDDAHWTAVVMFYSFRGGCDEAIMGTQRTEDIASKLNDLFSRILGVGV